MNLKCKGMSPITYFHMVIKNVGVTKQSDGTWVLLYQSFSLSTSLQCSCLKLPRYSKLLSPLTPSAEAPGCWGCPVSQAGSILPPEKESDAWETPGISWIPPSILFLCSIVLWPA